MKKRQKKISKWLFWTPRILSLMFAAFLSIFSWDVFSESSSFWQIVLGLFMHNIPVFILLIIIWISWKHEIVGAIGFIFAGLLYIFWTMNRVPWYIVISWSMIIAVPAFIIGILFLINWQKKR